MKPTPRKSKKPRLNWKGQTVTIKQPPKRNLRAVQDAWLVRYFAGEKVAEVETKPLAETLNDAERELVQMSDRHALGGPQSSSFVLLGNGPVSMAIVGMTKTQGRDIMEACGLLSSARLWLSLGDLDRAGAIAFHLARYLERIRIADEIAPHEREAEEFPALLAATRAAWEIVAKLRAKNPRLYDLTGSAVLQEIRGHGVKLSRSEKTLVWTEKNGEQKKLSVGRWRARFKIWKDSFTLGPNVNP